MMKCTDYTGWKWWLFWGLWLLLLAPGYIAADVAWLIGKMLLDFHAPIDIILTLIMGLTLLLIMSIAVYTAWHFVRCSRAYPHLLIILSIGVLGLPLVSTAGALVSYVSLS